MGPLSSRSKLQLVTSHAHFFIAKGLYWLNHQGLFSRWSEPRTVLRLRVDSLCPGCLYALASRPFARGTRTVSRLHPPETPGCPSPRPLSRAQADVASSPPVSRDATTPGFPGPICQATEMLQSTGREIPEWHRGPPDTPALHRHNLTSHWLVSPLGHYPSP